MDLYSKKTLAAKILNVGKSRVKLDPKEADRLGDAITRASIRALVKDGTIWVIPKQGVSKGRHRIKILKKRTKGHGGREGAKGARSGKKIIWISKVRLLRRHLKVLRDRGVITGAVFDKIYLQVKGGQIRNLKHLREIVREVSRR
jgi:large subunit ribosomal protein L19e